MSDPGPFRRRTAVWLYAVGVVSFACAIAIAVSGGAGMTGASAGADAFSRSAVGHRAFVDTLRRLGITVVVSQQASASKAARGGSVLMVLEPPAGAHGAARVEELLDAPSVLLVLPKWSARPRTDRADRVDSAWPVPLAPIEQVLSTVIEGARIHRPRVPVRWQAGPLEVAPDLASPQLVRVEDAVADLVPLVASDQGILVAEIDRGARRVLLLTDPDVIANHGIGRGDNAIFAVRLVERLLEPGEVVVVDETVHGYRRSPEFWPVLFEFPFVIATFQTAIAALVLLWSATLRFGAPLPLAPALRAGKLALVDSTAGLLEHGGHERHVVRRYAHATLRDLARRLRAPRLGDDDALWAWLGRLGESRGTPLDIPALVGEIEHEDGPGARAASHHLLSAARRLHRWKQEMLDGRGDG